MHCRIHAREIDYKDLLEHMFEHVLNTEELVMAALNTDNLNAAADRVAAKVAELQNEADANGSNDDANQAAVDAVTAKLDAIAPAPVGDPAVDESGTPIGDSITDGTADPAAV